MKPTRKIRTTITNIALAGVACAFLANCGSGEDSADAGPKAQGGSEERAKPAPAPEEDPAPEVTTKAVTHPNPGDAEAGKAVYMRICVACHQADGSGMNGLLAADFVKDKSRLAKSNEELITSIRDGITRDGKIMPPQKGILSDQEIKDAISYIRTTFGGASS